MRILILLLFIAFGFSTNAQCEKPKTVTGVKVSGVQTKKPKTECVEGKLFYINKDGELKPIVDKDGKIINCKNNQ